MTTISTVEIVLGLHRVELAPEWSRHSLHLCDYAVTRHQQRDRGTWVSDGTVVERQNESPGAAPPDHRRRG
jgi:hypothetical protein